MTIDKPKIHGAFILLGMVLFFPVGIVLLLVRFVTHYKYNHLRANDYMLVGHAFITFYAFIAFIVMLASETTSDVVALLIVFGILIGVPAIIFYIVGARRKKKMANLYNLYYHLTTAQGIDAIDRIAELTGEKPRNVTQDISYMIVSGRLTDARLDPTAQLVIMGNRTAKGQENPNPVGGPATREQIIMTDQVAAARAGAGASSQPAPKMVTCSGCGSSSKVIPGQRQDCEFCGNSLFIPS
ncbi:phage holin family protein [Cohnella abietis]|uniref:Uncharacterized protein n=1 Tax=Cohnella abietis TaxID=2507935 RepID=A0A3T1DF83_9BACL|nr:phage holin family protein [Cohnella abietis]BBI36753.1 hypothetical protein KCTCHS21_61520 [Cohnella abietis]